MEVGDDGEDEHNERKEGSDWVDDENGGKSGSR